MTAIKTGPRCIAAIKDFEKHAPLNGVSLAAFDDGYGNWTIGWGRVNHPDGSKVRVGDMISLAQAEAFLMEDVGIAERVVARAIAVPLAQDHFDALVMFAFNCGGRLIGSSIAKAINAGNIDQVPALWMQWRFATDVRTGQKVESRGLVRRRRAELELWRGLDQPDREEAIAIAPGSVTNARPGAVKDAIRSSWTVKGLGLALVAKVTAFLGDVSGFFQAALVDVDKLKAAADPMLQVWGLFKGSAPDLLAGLTVAGICVALWRRITAAMEGRQA